MKLENIIGQINEEDLIWRITRTNTFVDLLMLQYHKVASQGLNSDHASLIIQTAIKAIVNYDLGTIDVKTNYKETLQEIREDKTRVTLKINAIVEKALNQSNNKENLSSFQMLQYFKVLNNLDLGNYEVDVFYDILNAVLFSGVIETDVDNK